MTHYQIWHAIELFAHAHGLSCSGLAKRSGLDPTTFNKSKRMTQYGQERWPINMQYFKNIVCNRFIRKRFL